VPLLPSRRTAVAVSTAPRAVAPGRPPDGQEAGGASAVDALRARLADRSAREHVVLDFLEDDLDEARTALAAVNAYVSNVEDALRDGEPTQGRFLSLAIGGAPIEHLDSLQQTLGSLRRRLAQVAARM
jgi:hypothetical protein